MISNYEILAGMTKAVRLTDSEAAFCKEHAEKRNGCKRNSGGDKGLKKHQDGLFGEICFAKLYGGSIDMGIYPKGDGNRPDVTLRNGMKVEVKAATFKYPDVSLKLQTSSLGKSKYYSLVKIVDDNTGLVFPIWTWEYLKVPMTYSQREFGRGSAVHTFTPINFKDDYWKWIHLETVA